MVVLLAGAAFAAGVGTAHYKTFPFGLMQQLIADLRHLVDPGLARGKWSIGIYSGDTPFELGDEAGLRNPVMEPEAATGIPSRFVADPFMVTRDGTYYVFYEALNPHTGFGEIAYSTSTDLKDWNFGAVVVKADYHFSYPHVFQWEGEYYMTPETATDYAVHLYKAKNFPDDWEHVGHVIQGYSIVDPTIFRHDDTWWMFGTTGDNDVLNLYYSSDLLTGWQPHPQNPIVKQDKMNARSAGPVLAYDGVLYRFAQDGRRYYGEQVHVYRVEELTKKVYKEKLFKDEPVIAPSRQGWNAAGMHHVDLHFVNGRWVAVVDGKSRR